MSNLETATDFRAAFDTLLAATQRQLRLYDRDLSLLDVDNLARHAALRAFCVAGGGRRIEFLLDDIRRAAHEHPRLMMLLRDFGHVIEIRQAPPDTPLPDQAFVLADRHGVLVRADKGALPGSLHLDDARDAANLHQTFDALWQRAPASVSATTLGL